MSKERLKQDANQYTSEMLSMLPFQTIYSCADVLFDKEHMKNDDQRIKGEITFLKNTQLKELEFEDTDDESSFKMINKTTRESIQVSNRISGRGELRGQLLRQHIETQQQKNGNQTAYDTILNAIQSPVYSDCVTMLKGVLVGETVKERYEGHSMSATHFTLFSRFIICAIKNKIATGIISSTLEPLDIMRDKDMQKFVLKDIDIDHLYDFTEQLVPANEQVASCVVTALEKAMSDFSSGRLNTQSFEVQCNIVLDATAEFKKNEAALQNPHFDAALTQSIFKRFISKILLGSLGALAIAGLILVAPYALAIAATISVALYATVVLAAFIGGSSLMAVFRGLKSVWFETKLNDYQANLAKLTEEYGSKLQAIETAYAQTSDQTTDHESGIVHSDDSDAHEDLESDTRHSDCSSESIDVEVDVNSTVQPTVSEEETPPSSFVAINTIHSFFRSVNTADEPNVLAQSAELTETQTTHTLD